MRQPPPRDFGKLKSLDVTTLPRRTGATHLDVGFGQTADLDRRGEQVLRDYARQAPSVIGACMKSHSSPYLDTAPVAVRAVANKKSSDVAGSYIKFPLGAAELSRHTNVLLRPTHSRALAARERGIHHM
jgi:hypothetical protein